MKSVHTVKSRPRSACLPRTRVSVRLRYVTDKEQARAELLAAARAFKRADAVMKQRREALRNAIVRSGSAGETKSQIARDTGYTREYVTTLLADAAKQRQDVPVE